MFSKRLLTLLSVLWLIIGINADDNNPESKPKSEYKKSLSRDCTSTYSTTCLKLDIVSLVDKLNEEEEYSVVPGVSVIREERSDHSTTADMVTELAKDFPNDPDARLDAFLMKKVTTYLNNHSLRLNLLNRDALESARKGGGGGGGGGGNKGGGGGGLGMILAAGAMLKGTFLALALGAIAAIAGKALITGLISFLLSSIIGLKALGHGHKSTTYEIVSKPVYSHSSSHSVGHEEHHPSYGHSSYGRSFDVPLPLGLQPEYKPA